MQLPIYHAMQHCLCIIPRFCSFNFPFNIFNERIIIIMTFNNKGSSVINVLSFSIHHILIAGQNVLVYLVIFSSLSHENYNNFFSHNDHYYPTVELLCHHLSFKHIIVAAFLFYFWPPSSLFY